MSKPSAHIAEQRVSDGGTGVLVKSTPRLPAGLSTVPRVSEPAFVGREGCFRTIEDKLRAHPEVVLCGPPGVGKTRILLEYAQRHEPEYPGGRFFVDFEDGAPPHDLEQLHRVFELQSYNDEPFEDRCRRALQMIVAASREHGRVLVICDAVPNLEVLREWSPPSASGVQVLAATTSMAAMDGDAAVEVDLLCDQDAEKLTDEIFRGQAGFEQLKIELVARAGGVTIELCASAQSVRQAVRHGRKPKLDSLLAAEKTVSSYGLAWRLLPEDTRLLLKLACMYISRDVPVELVREVLVANGWTSDKVDEHVDSARDRGMATGFGDELRIHQLTAKFIRAASDVSCAHLRPALWKTFRRVAGEFADKPGSSSLRKLLLSHEPDASSWPDVTGDWERMGYAYVEAGHFAEAQSWYERAVREHEHGDLHDHQNLCTCVHQVGNCLIGRGLYSEALPWCLRAVQEGERELQEGRGDHELLGGSIHHVGHCLFAQGKFAEAQTWYERAVEETALGDQHGNVHHDALGMSIGRVGLCMMRQGLHADALPWLKRAVSEAEMGETGGLVDPDSVGTSMNLVGECFASQADYTSGLAWYERAAEEIAKGSSIGVVNHQRLGESLHQVGCCLHALGRHNCATDSFERAAEEKEQGDAYGRVDHESLGCSAHQVGWCLSNQRKFADALPWFQRAVREKEQGDVHARVDHESLGRSVHQVGYCLSKQGKFAEAQPWFERAKSLGYAEVSNN